MPLSLKRVSMKLNQRKGEKIGKWYRVMYSKLGYSKKGRADTQWNLWKRMLLPRRRQAQRQVDEGEDTIRTLRYIFFFF